MNEEEVALEAIQKKLVGKALSYQEIYAIMDEIAHDRLNKVLTTYFAASGYSKGFTNEELFFLTKAMVDTGEKLEFSGIVADKHSIGGVPGTRTTLILVPIVAAAGYTIPKSSSRAITTPDGTADDMEVLSKVTFTKEELYDIVKKAGGCIVWGGGFKIAPADDVLIQVEKPLMFESFDKIIVSVLAKKVAFGSNHVVIDVPYGPTVKVHSREDAEVIKTKFEYVANKFGIKIKVLPHETEEPAGRGVGPILEVQEALRVLEQTSDRPIDLENRALNLAGELLGICLESEDGQRRQEILQQFQTTRDWAKSLLTSGAALKKMQAIISEQGGDTSVTSQSLQTKLGTFTKDITSEVAGKVTAIDSKHTTVLGRMLGAPDQKGAGMFMHKKVGDSVAVGDVLMTYYSEQEATLQTTIDSTHLYPMFTIQ